MNETLSLDYLAGIFDSEGCLSASVRNQPGRRSMGRLVICIGMTYLPTLNEFHSRFGGNLSRRRPVKDRKPLFFWELRDARSQLAFLLALQPSLREKRAQAQKAIAYLTARIEHPVTHVPPSIIEWSLRLCEDLKSEKRLSFSL